VAASWFSATSTSLTVPTIRGLMVWICPETQALSVATQFCVELHLRWPAKPASTGNTRPAAQRRSGSFD
jgi:hypothetical protein